MPLTQRDLAWWLEAESYVLKRLAEIRGDGKGPTVYGGQIAPSQLRIWRIHELMEELEDQEDLKKKEEPPF